MKRKLFTILAAISLLLCLATVGLCIGTLHSSLTWNAAINLTNPERSMILGCGNGSIHVRRGLGIYSARRINYTTSINKGWGFYSFRDSEGEWLVEIALVYFVIAFALVPAAWTYFSLRRNQANEGCCAACGYDLRATPERCPECGTMTRMKDEG